MEDAPLISGSGKGASIKTVLLVVLAVGFIAAVIGVIVLGVKLRDAKRPILPPEPSPSPPSPSPPDSSYDLSLDFPLAPAGAWNVSANHDIGVSFTVTEGTWMNVDLHNNELVFDLLGDIYKLPTTGGNAELLVGGVAWQTQPRFSPDGNYIIYSSDESGCDNIWVYNVATRQSMQVTYEPFFYVTNAKWVNATHIVANKWHLVESRGIAGAEIWMWRVPTDWANPIAWGDLPSKNKGVQIVGRTDPIAQFGPEEPEPQQQGNGRFLFYSRNMIDTTRWTYNKDPHAGIYAILRLDRTTGETKRITGGPGGAARPVISHDGLLLAFIRRTLFSTSLMIHNIESGNDFILMDLHYQDQQESYAPCGVFPSFSFDSNDDNIIVWSGGKLVSIPVTGGTPTNIPFSVNVNLQLADVIRSQHNVRQDVNDTSATFTSRVSMHSTRNFRGTHVTWSTLGEIYLANFTSVGDGNMSTPIKVAPSNSTLYYWPTVDLNAKRMARTAWSDEEFGWVEIVNLETQVATKITTMPGRYVNPVYDDNGSYLLYGMAGGDAATGSRYSANAGVYMARLDAATGLPRSSAESQIWLCNGEWAEFSGDGTAYVTTSSSYPYTIDEVSVIDDGTFGKLQRHFITAQYASNVAVSPHGQLVAFIEFEVVYVQQIPYKDLDDSDYPFKLSAIEDNRQRDGRTQILSKVGGDYLSWSGNSLSFGWANNFTTVDLSPMTSRDWAACGNQYCFMRRQYMRSFSMAIEAPVGTAYETLVVFENATVIPMDPRNESLPFPNSKILVRGDKIEQIGDFENPVGATIINLQGSYVLPGFVDAHAHWSSAFTQRWGKSNQGWEFLMNLAFGVTTLHNPSAEFWSVWADAELIKSGKKIGPRIFSTATPMFGGGGPDHCEVATVGAAEEALQRRQAFGGFSAKSYMIQCRAGRQKVLQAARNLNFEVVPEGGMHYAWDQSFIIDGHTTVEHSLPMAPFYDDVLSLFAAGKTAWTPTLVVAFGGLWGDRYYLQESNVFEDPTVMKWIPNDEIRPVGMRRQEADDRDYHVFTISKAATNVSSRGQLVNIGAHGQMQGIGYLWELKLMAAGGMSNYDVLKTATINPAKTLGLDSQIGSLYPGKLADLVILDQAAANPLTDLDALKDIKYVMLDGKLYNTADFSQVLPVAKPAPTLTPINTPSL